MQFDRMQISSGLMFSTKGVLPLLSRTEKTDNAVKINFSLHETLGQGRPFVHAPLEKQGRVFECALCR